MGLDGISANQLRITRDNTSKENSIFAEMSADAANSTKSVNSLDKKGAIDADDKENTSFFGGESSSEEESDKNDTENIEDMPNFEKIDLTDKKRYEVALEPNSSITIYNKEKNMVVQKISPNELLTLVDNLKNPGGIFVNKKV